MKYEVRSARYDEIDEIMSFIREHWSSSHILGNDRGFFEYLHCNNGNVCFLVAKDATRGLVGIHGYTFLSSVPNPPVATSVWRALQTEDFSLGSRLLRHFWGNSPVVFSMGINSKTIAYYKMLKCKVGQLRHYYRIANLENYKIATVHSKNILPVSNNAFSVTKVTNIPAVCGCSCRQPQKDLAYLQWRYEAHPKYKYDLYQIASESGSVLAVVVCREVVHNGAKILKIIDVIGDEKSICHAGYGLQKIMDANNYEYIECYCYGIDDDIMRDAGFSLRKDGDPNIVPNYFEPFVNDNIDISFYATNFENLVLFKGDGDQDRPSR